MNVLGAILTTQAAIKHFGEGSSIINIGSGVTRITPANSTVYTGTKGALIALTGVWSREFGPRKIRVNSINPGMVETEGTHSRGIMGSDLEKWLISQAPLGRTGQVTDINPIAVFLTNPAGLPANSSWRQAEFGKRAQGPVMARIARLSAGHWPRLDKSRRRGAGQVSSSLTSS